LGANIAPKTLIVRSKIPLSIPVRSDASPFLEPAVGQAQRCGSSVAGSDEVAGDVDAEYVRAELRSGHRRGHVAGPEVKDVEAGGDPDLIDVPFAAGAHGRRDPGEVALLPQRFVRVHRDRFLWFSDKGLGRGCHLPVRRGHRQPRTTWTSTLVPWVTTS
jgi:hypothetical protein